MDPTEQQLNSRVEYDMDEQDKCWLTNMNKHRRREGHLEVAEGFFELVMDRLEKEWFELVRIIFFFPWKGEGC